MSVITKYAVYSQKLKQFWGKNRVEPLNGDNGGFTSNVEHAKLYTLEGAEREVKSTFWDHHAVAVPIRIVMTPVFRNLPSPENTIERYRALAKEFEEMSLDDADRLSKTKLSEYRKARSLVKAYDEEHKNESK